MTRTSYLSPLLLAVSLSPAFLQGTCSPKSGNPNLVLLEIEAGGLDRLVGFDTDTLAYSVWLDGAATFIVRATAEDSNTAIGVWPTGDVADYVLLGNGSGETTIDTPADGTTIIVQTKSTGGIYKSFQITINPTCTADECDDNDACSTDVCNASSRCVFSMGNEGGVCSLEDGATGWCIQGTCQISSLCPAGKCADGKECTQDSCDPADGICDHVPYGDFRECNGTAGICVDDKCITGDSCLRVGYGRINCCATCGAYASTCQVLLPPGSDCDPTGREAPGVNQAGHCAPSGECLWDDGHPDAGLCLDSQPCVDDTNDCTAQWCDPEFGCKGRNLTGTFPCNGDSGGTCIGGTCVFTDCCSGPGGYTPCCKSDDCCTSNFGVCKRDFWEGTACSLASGVDGICSLTPSAVQVGWYDAKCVALACKIEDPNDPPNFIEMECDDGLECTEDACDPNTGACVYAPLPELTPCNGGTGVCLAGGVCADVPQPCASPNAICHPCTLQGVLDAISAGGGPHEFSCTGPQVVTITGTLDIVNDVILDGGGLLTIEGNNSDLVLQVSSGVTVELRAMTLSRGISATGGPGAIVNDGTLTLTDMTVTDSDSSGSFGGPVHNNGSLAVVRSVFIDNTGNNGSGAITNSGTLDLLDSYFFNNSTTGQISDYFSQGGALWNSGDATLTNTTIDGNYAAYGGGGIYNSGTLALSGSRVSNNSAPAGLGGGIWNASPGGLTMVDCEIDDNTAVDQGGGIYNDGVVFGMLRGSVSGNVVSDPGVATGWGGGIATQGTDVTLTNVRVANNRATGDDSRGGGINTSDPGSLTLVDGMVIGNSAVGARSDGGGVFFDGGLSPLMVTGTTVWGNYSARFGGGLCILGASASIVDSVIASNIAGNDGGGISSQGALLTITDADVSDNSAVDDGGGIAVGNSLLLERTTVRTNSAEGEGGGIHVGAAANVSVTDASGVTGNIAGGAGGGLRVFRGTLVVLDSTIDGNQSGTLGGGLSSYGDTSGNTNVTIERSTVSGNTADSYGGGIESQWTRNTLTLDESAIIGNASTTAGGGGIYAQDGATAFIVNSTIAQNTAAVGGGGLRVNDSNTVVNVTHTTFAANTTGTSGESIALVSGQVNIQNSLLFMNTCNAALTSLGGNLEAGANTCGLSSGSGDAIVPPAGVNLSALGLNGGPTVNYLPGPGSSAIDFSPCLVDVTTEQRGINTRPQGPACDCGAVEAP